MSATTQQGCYYPHVTHEETEAQMAEGLHKGHASSKY